MSSAIRYDFQANWSAGFLITDVGASAATIIALCGLTGVNGPLMAVLATIVLGATYLGKGIVLYKARMLTLQKLNLHILRLEMFFIILGGACGVILGVIVLLDAALAVLIPVASIVFGIATLVLGSIVVSDSGSGIHPDGFVTAADRFWNTGTFIGVASIILATLAAANVEYDVTLNLVSLFCLGASNITSFTSPHSIMYSFIRSRL